VSPAVARRRALLDLFELVTATDERFYVPVPKQAAYAQAMRRLQDWQLLHETTLRAWFSGVSEEE
jgi:hypothetical protein